jgi:hypothetical protein
MIENFGTVRLKKRIGAKRHGLERDKIIEVRFVYDSSDKMQEIWTVNTDKPYRIYPGECIILEENK